MSDVECFVFSIAISRLCSFFRVVRQDRLEWLNEQIEEWHGKNTFKDDGKEENSYLSAQ